MPLTNLRTTPSELAIFYTELGKLFSQTDLSLVECLDILQPGIENAALYKSVGQLRSLAGEGYSLAECFDKTPQIGNKIIVRLLENTQSRTETHSILSALADALAQTEAMREIKEKIFFWPFAYLVIAMIVVATLSIWVLPSIAMFYETMRTPLPLATQSLMLMNWESMLAVIVLIAILYVFYRQPGSLVRKAFDGAMLRLPLLGRLNKKIAVNQYLHMLSTLLLRKIPVADALVFAAESVDNKVLAHAFIKAAATPGRDLHETLRANPMIPKRFITAIAVGEKTQSMDEVFRFSVESYGDALINDMQRYQDSLELVLKIAIGIVFGHIAIAVYLPIFKMGAAI
jgi:type IV pilus assembly protein PilC